MEIEEICAEKLKKYYQRSDRQQGRVKKGQYLYPIMILVSLSFIT